MADKKEEARSESMKGLKKLLDSIEISEDSEDDRVLAICHNCGKEIKNICDGVNYDGTIYCSCCWDNDDGLAAFDD